MPDGQRASNGILKHLVTQTAIQLGNDRWQRAASHCSDTLGNPNDVVPHFEQSIGVSRPDKALELCKGWVVSGTVKAARVVDKYYVSFYLVSKYRVELVQDRRFPVALCRIPFGKVTIQPK